MKKTFLLILFLSLLSQIGYSQKIENLSEQKSMNAITLGVIGEGNTFSLNYSRKILRRPKFFIDAKLGIGFVNYGISIFGRDTSKKDFGLSHAISFNYGGKGHFLELGVGGNVFYIDQDHLTGYIFFPTVGYKYQSQGRARVQFTGRLFIHPRSTDSDYGLFFPVGVAVGISF